MTIKQITLQGFKSFARKTTFTFDTGVTAIVGPNGSGKSNVADALRWVLGEQSAKALRVKKTEDLIFAGTGSKARGSVAEVSVLFDNSDGSAPIEFSEIELSRKLYGSGESDYRLNGRKVRLAEVQQLLASARLGAGSYAITSQGTIDSLIVATPAERKLLFEEASGIRTFELQRATALKRMQATELNVQRARDVLAELAPRLTVLERNIATLQKRDALTTELAALQEELVAARRLELGQRLSAITSTIEPLRENQTHQQTEIEKLREQQRELEAVSKQAKTAQREAARKLDKQEAAREQLLNDASVQQAELQHLQERLQELKPIRERQATLQQQLTSRADELKAFQHDLTKAYTEQAACNTEREQIIAGVRKLQQRLVKQRKLMQETNQHEYVRHAQTIISDLYRALQSSEIDKDHLQMLTHRVRRLLKLAGDGGQAEALEEIRELQSELGTAISQREAIDERYAHATLRVRSLELDISGGEKALSEAKKQFESGAKELIQIERISTYIARREQAISKLQIALKENQAEIQSLRAILSSAHVQSVDEVVAVARQLERLQMDQTETKRLLDTAVGEKTSLEAELAKMARSKATTTVSAEQIERNIVQTESRLIAIDEMGQDTSEEYASTKERHDELLVQLQDLEAAGANLSAIIGQLDAAIREQFATAFEEISDRFGELFAKLFNGGNARLKLQQENDEFGIEIEVVPAGKRVRHLTALSGGERSLAGVALLAAIVQVNPSPILVLDEVDAALDEANAARFSKLLAELASSSQLVVITHNRQTMLAADTLFGVTMDPEQVSRSVSVQLEAIPA